VALILSPPFTRLSAVPTTREKSSRQKLKNSAKSKGFFLFSVVSGTLESVEGQVKTRARGSQVKTQDVVEDRQSGPWNGGTAIAVGVTERGQNVKIAKTAKTARTARKLEAAKAGEPLSPALKVEQKSVFEVKDARLAIGRFSRPLLPAEARNFRRAWELDPMPGFGEFELGKERISFVTPPENVPIAWKSIDRLLAFATESVRKAS
jgi:hypothetical protein